LRKKTGIFTVFLVFFAVFPFLLSASMAKDDILRSTGVRAVGMGGAFTSVADDYSAFFWNPAGTVLADRVNINVFLDSIFGANQINYGINYTHPLMDDMSVSGAFMHTSFINSNFIKDTLFLTYATYLDEKRSTSFGVNLKLINIAMLDYDLNGFSASADIGILVFPDMLDKKIRFGFFAQDINASIGWTGGASEKIPVIYRIGTSYIFDKTAVAAFDLELWDYRTEEKDPRAGIHIGGEKWFLSETIGNFGFRAGLAWRTGVDIQYTFGFSYGREDFTVDYVFVPGISGLGETHKIDFSYFIGKRLKKQKDEEIIPEMPGAGLKFLIEKFKSMSMSISQKYISPNKDGIFDRVKVFMKNAPRIMRNLRWQMSVLDPQSNTVREFKGRERIDAELTWDGLGESKKILKDGDYTFKYVVLSGDKVVWNKNRVVTVDTVPPRFSHYLVPKIFAPHKKSSVKQMKIGIVPKDSDVKEWKMLIKDKAGNVIRRMSGEGITKSLLWEGRDALGNTAKDGNYEAVVSLTDFAGNKNELSEPFTVDTYISKFNLVPRSRIINIGSEKITFAANRRDLDRIKQWDVEIRDEQGKLVRSFKNNSTRVTTVAWDGTDAKNKYARQGAFYTYRVIITQKNGIVAENDGIIQSGLPEFKGMGIELTLAAIDFNDNGKDIPVDEYAYLNQAADAVKKYAKNYLLIIRGYATDSGSAGRNLRLSMDRVKAVKNYLVTGQNVPADNIYTIAYGDGEYIPAGTRQEIEKNGRRVEVELITK